MALLAPGGYQLPRKDGIREKKSVLFVKLTASAQRALSDFLENKNPSTAKPIIEFNKDNGLLQIPTSSKGVSESDRCMAQFRFNVDSNVTMQGQQGRFECIQHKHGSTQLKNVGPMTKRLRIHANEDVFETTKNRMAEIDLEQRKVCTRQIDLNLEAVNRRVRVDRNAKPSVPPKPVPAIENRNSRTVLLKSLKTRSKAQTSNTPKLFNPVGKRPLRERIIHMLAVRSLKKIELSAALRRDGLRETDKAHLATTLSQVSTLKDNVYHLLRHVWNDVQEDWAFYSEQERQQMKRNKPQNLTPPTSDSGISTTSNQSPTPSAGDRSPSCQYKRPGYHNGVDGFQTKRQRISHFSRPNWKSSIGSGVSNEENVSQISPSRITHCFDEIIEKSGLSATAIKNPPLMKNHKQNTSSKTAANADEVQSNKISTSTIVTTPSYLEQYVTVTNAEQRRQYKLDFKKNYDEYMSLGKEVSATSETFEELGKSLKRHRKGSPEFQKIESEIFELYTELNTTSFRAKRTRYEYLHNKLSYIKKLVHDYDANM